MIRSNITQAQRILGCGRGQVLTDIRINAHNAGEWVMRRAGGGRFTPLLDVVFSRHHSDGRIRGGIVLSNYLGASMTAHMAGDDKHWCNRELLWMVFHYAFVQLGCHKMLAPVASDSPAAAIDLRGGWELEAIIRDAYEPGKHLLIISMTKDKCPWLNYRPKEWQPGSIKSSNPQQLELFDG